MKKTIGIASVAALMIAAASPADACTESLFRVGKGVSYREYQAPLPGNILMVARTKTEHLVAEWLAHTGHNVQVVEDPGHLAAYIKQDKFDVLLAKYSDREFVKAEEAAAGSSIKYLPFADGTAADREQAKAEFRQAVSTEASPRELLKAIHKTLKSETNVKASY